MKVFASRPARLVRPAEKSPPGRRAANLMPTTVGINVKRHGADVWIVDQKIDEDDVKFQSVSVFKLEVDKKRVAVLEGADCLSKKLKAVCVKID